MRVSVYRNHETIPSTNIKFGLALCGGGITGGLFEVGTLMGINDFTDDTVERRFRSVVGSSAGASVAVPVAKGVTAERIFRACADPDDPYFGAKREQILAIDWSYHFPILMKMAVALPKGSLRWAFGRSDERRWTDAVYSELATSLPPGLFSIEGYGEFYSEFLWRNGLSNYFDETGQCRLYITANDVDSSERVVFGKKPFSAVEIGKCVAASSAIPMLFKPVEVSGRHYFDGGIGRVAHADLLVSDGCNRVIIINPVVPFNHDSVRRSEALPPADNVAERGFFWVLNQAYRIMNKVKLHLGIEALVTQHPGLEVLLFEPDDEDLFMFTGSSMSFARRASVLEGARQAARAGLERESPQLGDFLS